MRALLLHTDRFETRVIEKSNRPKNIVPEERKSDFEKMEDNLTVFCVEEGDGEKQLQVLYKEILCSAKELGVRKIMVAPFVHLSKKIAKPNIAKRMYEEIVEKLRKESYEIGTSHFGYHRHYCFK